jgi:hypothetical protein
MCMLCYFMHSYFVFGRFLVKIHSEDRVSRVFSLYSSVRPGRCWDGILKYDATTSFHILHVLLTNLMRRYDTIQVSYINHTYVW